MATQPDPTVRHRDDLSGGGTVTDPVTGTTGVDPLQPAGGQRPGGNWGVAARWLAFAFIAVIGALLLVWLT
jgi:hypothetical protein